MSNIFDDKLKKIESELQKYQKKVETNIEEIISEKDKIKQEILYKAKALEEKMEHLNLESEIEKIKGQILSLAPKKIAEVRSIMEDVVRKIPNLPDIPDIMDLIKNILTMPEPPEIPDINLRKITDFICQQTGG
ncbi:hypothetical protein EOM09_03205 [bacterium]|nr:hypothetical protein [bacterium]